MRKLLIKAFCIFILPTMVFAESFSIKISALKNPIAVPTENENYIVYELQIFNSSDKILRLGLVDVADENNTPILTYFGETLKQQSVFYKEKNRVDNTNMELAQKTGMFLFFTIALPKTQKVPSSLQNRLFFVETNENKSKASVEIVSYLVEVSQDKPLMVNPPLRGSNWVAAGALSEYSYHRRAILPINGEFYLAQRYAVDWEQICTDGRAVRDDALDNDNWTGFGQDVLAAVDGVVSKIQDGIPENIPFSLPAPPLQLSEFPGNYVIIKARQEGETYYILNAHMQPGSIQVKEGDTVTAGQVIGAVGNTGNSFAPHLHFHVMDANDPLKAEGVPFVFNETNLVGNLKLIDANYGIWKTLLKRNETFFKNIAPIDNQLFDFSKEKRFKCP